MKNLFCFEWKRNQKSLLIWGLCQLGLILSGYIEYIFVFQNNADIPAIMSQLPPSVAVLMGISSYVDFSDSAGFYCLMADFVFYVMTVYAVLLGNGLFAYENNGRTADFLYTRPIERRSVAVSKYTSGIICCIELNFFTLLGSILTFGTDRRVFNTVFWFALGSVLMQAVFFSAGALFAAVSERAGSSLSMLFWMITVLGGKFLAMTDITSGPLMLFSFRDYFPAEQWLFRNGTTVCPWIAASVILALLSFAAFHFQRKKDF